MRGQLELMLNVNSSCLSNTDSVKGDLLIGGGFFVPTVILTSITNLLPLENMCIIKTHACKAQLTLTSHDLMLRIF